MTFHCSGPVLFVSSLAVEHFYEEADPKYLVDTHTGCQYQCHGRPLPFITGNHVTASRAAFPPPSSPGHTTSVQPADNTPQLQIEVDTQYTDNSDDVDTTRGEEAGVSHTFLPHFSPSPAAVQIPAVRSSWLCTISPQVSNMTRPAYDKATQPTVAKSYTSSIPAVTPASRLRAASADGRRDTGVNAEFQNTSEQCSYTCAHLRPLPQYPQDSPDGHSYVRGTCRTV